MKRLIAILLLCSAVTYTQAKPFRSLLSTDDVALMSDLATTINVGAVAADLLVVSSMVYTVNSNLQIHQTAINPHGITADAIGALTLDTLPPVVIPDETDPRAMRLYHYGDPDIVITPASDFTFNAASGAITGYTGSNHDIVLPYEINGVPVVTIGDSAFGGDSVLKTLTAPKTLTTISNSAFYYGYLTSLVAPSLTTIGDHAFTYTVLTSLVAPALTSIGDYAFADTALTSLVAPSLTTIGSGAFYYSSLTSLVAPSLTTLSNQAFAYSSLTAIYYGGNQPTAGADIYLNTPTNLISYVTNPTATGWGDTFGDRPVVRLPLYADEVYSGGQLVATQYYVNDAIANIPPVDIPNETDPVFTAWDKSTDISITENQITDLKPYATETYVGDAIANIPPVAIPDETDPRAMKLYHYGDPDIQITPESDFTFNAASGTITGYTGTNPNIVLPYEINGVPVVAIGDSVFDSNGVVKTLTAPKTLTTIDSYAFAYTPLTSLVAPALTTIGSYAFAYTPLTSLVAPALTSIGDYAFAYGHLPSIYYGGNQPTAGADIYLGAPTNLVSYVTNPTATGWGDFFGGRPVVRLPLYADEVYSGGSLVATISPSSPWTTNIVASGAQTLKGTWGSQPRLQLSGGTTIDIDWTTYDTNGINRISLTIVSGEHPVIWSTDNIEFEEVPELSTTGSSTILIRKVGTEKAQGRQL